MHSGSMVIKQRSFRTPLKIVGSGIFYRLDALEMPSQQRLNMEGVSLIRHVTNSIFECTAFYTSVKRKSN